LIASGKEEKYKIIDYFIEHKSEPDKLKEYAWWRLVGATHKQITDTDADAIADTDSAAEAKTKEKRAQEVIGYLEQNQVYDTYYIEAFKQLLRLNVEEDNKLKRKFDFIFRMKNICRCIRVNGFHIISIFPQSGFHSGYILVTDPFVRLFHLRITELKTYHE
jgi:hypothetical protein